MSFGQTDVRNIFLLDIKYSCTYLVVHSQFWLNTCHFAKQVWEVE